MKGKSNFELEPTSLQQKLAINRIKNRAKVMFSDFVGKVSDDKQEQGFNLFMHTYQSAA